MYFESIKCGKRDIPHNTAPWRVAKNRHPNTDGTEWGWIEGAPEGVFWSDNGAFTSEKAGRVVAEHNRWLEAQKPIALRIIEATAVAAKARQKSERARKEADACEAALDAALAELTRLEALRDESLGAQPNEAATDVF